VPTFGNHCGDDLPSVPTLSLSFTSLPFPSPPPPESSYGSSGSAVSSPSGSGPSPAVKRFLVNFDAETTCVQFFTCIGHVFIFCFIHRISSLACYDFDTRERILIPFGGNSTDEVSNQKMLYYATSNNLCFCTTWQNGKHENCIH